MVYGRTIITEGKRSFQYPPGIPNLKIFEPIEVKPFKLRSNCVYNMLRLYTAGPLYREKVNSYPDPNQWCDSIVRFLI